ncbi:hypothetical protein A6E01_20075 (plasmid) [Vibrio breoganii]|uniref:Uncharacterized protein n=1 Tax=Vibrio breoganii TaxID=553239 RepID=A0AAN0XZR8_9VIBR|nr:hypothetical protein [Vibrio breoganii]ANO35513.1 hypothetical protein A6E01_20075 [Vibrio breoganii]
MAVSFGTVNSIALLITAMVVLYCTHIQFRIRKLWHQHTRVKEKLHIALIDYLVLWVLALIGVEMYSNHLELIGGFAYGFLAIGVIIAPLITIAQRTNIVLFNSTEIIGISCFGKDYIVVPFDKISKVEFRHAKGTSFKELTLYMGKTPEIRLTRGGRHHDSDLWFHVGKEFGESRDPRDW